MVIDSVFLAQLAGAILSLAFSYIPGLNDWYEPLPSDKKRGIMALALVVVTLGVFGLSCVNLFDLGLNVTCDVAGAFGLVKILIGALIANQAVFLLTPKK